MALQALLLRRLLQEDGAEVSFLASNFDLPSPFQRMPGIRTILRFLLIWVHLWREVPRVAVVHVFAASQFYFFATVFPAILVGCLFGKRTVLNYRGGAAGLFFRTWGLAIRPIFRAATVVTTPSDFLGELIRETFGVRVSIVPNILDTSTFRFRQRTKFGPRLLVNRNLEKIYDVESVLHAYREILRSNSDASLWIVGSGSDEERLRGLAALWDLAGARFLGHVDHADLPVLFEDRDILLNASTIDNFPAALLEGSAAGLAVVSTKAGGIPFVYQNEKTALLVEVGDWQGLASAVDRIVRDPSLGSRLTKEGNMLAEGCAWKEVRVPLYEAYSLAFHVNTPEIVAGGR